ncbi:MAG: helix-turn-helix domain-containing protein [Planctomycetaceae bacterium]|nr:helix-turn-helix domain-containing protein [Planctomycetaceae bacterium]
MLSLYDANALPSVHELVNSGGEIVDAAADYEDWQTLRDHGYELESACERVLTFVNSDESALVGPDVVQKARIEFGMIRTALKDATPDRHDWSREDYRRLLRRLSENHLTKLALLVRGFSAVETELPKLRSQAWTFSAGLAKLGRIEIPVKGVKWRLLKKLAESDNAVSREDLLAAGWTDDGYNVEPSTLKKHLAELRQILREHLGYPASTDPIPAVDRGRDAAWRLENVTQT